MATNPVLIVGAGPTGMTAAIELRRAGLDVRIIDKSDHPALFSQALVVQARTLEQLQRYGIAAKAIAQGRKLKEIHVWSERKSILSIAADAIPSRYPYLLFLPQSQTEAILNELMESLGAKTERKTELVSFAQKSEGQTTEISAVIRHAGGREEQFSPRWILGCDGARSAVRVQAAIPFEGEGVSLSFFLGDFELEGPDAPGDHMLVHWHQGDVVFMGRISDKVTRMIVALHSQQDQDNSKRQLTIKDFQDAIDHAGIQIKIVASHWMTPFRVNDLQAKHYRAGNVFLAGDASHIHSPVGGQGMNTGMQDAANLGWKLAAVARGANDRLLDSYEEERAAVGKALINFTSFGLKMATNPSALFEKVRDAVLPLISKLRPIQKAALGFVSQTAIEYRSSSVVADHGGDGSLRAGDRMPDLTRRKKNDPATLLGDWTEATHLAILLDAKNDEADQMAARLSHARVVAINGSDLDADGQRQLGKDKKLLIVRPDGYIGFRAPLTKTAEFQAYAQQDALA
jgi:2-polyprenyl-6-methoxyphenol hydroxylase-like FAD-dependent oxidoreductase